jgi:hypothetical protein
MLGAVTYPVDIFVCLDNRMARIQHNNLKPLATPILPNPVRVENL